MGPIGGFPPDYFVCLGLSLKRVLYMPPAVIMGVGAAMSVVGGMKAGEAAEEQGNAEARFLNQQAEQEKLAQLRDLDAFDKERDRTLARARATFAAGGGDTTSGTALDNLAYQEGQFGEKRQSLISDSDARIAGLYARSESAVKAGRDAKQAALFSGIGKGLSSMSSVFKMPDFGKKGGALRVEDNKFRGG